MASAAFGIIWKQDKILLVKIAEPFREAHKWNFPGGVIEDGEAFEDGLAREVLEETGVTIKIENQVDNFQTFGPDNSIYIYSCTYISGELSLQDSELEDGGWFTAAEALDLPLAFSIRDYLINR